MKRIILIAIASAAIGALITFTILHKPEPDEEQPKSEQQRIAIENGEPTITLDAETQKKIGIVTTILTTLTMNHEVEAFGSVVDVKDLTDLVNQSAAASAQLQQARAKTSFDERELQRLRTLNADNKNVSDRAVQDAAATVAADNAQATAATTAINAAHASIVQRFGAAVADRPSLIEDLIAMRKVLVEVAMPPNVAPPPSLNGFTYLSPAPRVDPKLQGRTFFYVASGAKLSAGMNVSLRIPIGVAVGAVFVPPDAVVSWQGRAWIYVRRAPTKFARIDTGAAKLGDEVVTTGAQQLLSEEMRSQLHEE
jgi:hypothetical protein